MLYMVASASAMADIHYPNNKVVSEENAQKSCSQSATTYELFDELLMFYKSVDNGLPGIPPEKVRYYLEEIASGSLDRLSEVSKDPLFAVYSARNRIRKLNVNLELARASYKLPIKAKMQLTVQTIALTYRVSTDFEYMYENLERMGSLPKGRTSGFFTRLISDDSVYVLNNYMSCLVSKI